MGSILSGLPLAASDLVDYLNCFLNPPHLDRIERTVAALNELDRLMEETRYDPNTYLAIENGKFGKEAQRLSELVRDFDSKYRIGVRLGMPGPNGWSRIHTYFDRWPGGKPKDEGYMAAIFVLDAAYQGFLRQISKCSQCGKWFVMKRDDQRFCSGKCREKEFRSSDAGRMKRANYMRQYRARLKRRDEANLKDNRKRR